MPKNNIPAPSDPPQREAGYFVMVPDLNKPGIQLMIRLGLQPRTFLVRVKSLAPPRQKPAHRAAKAIGAERKFERLRPELQNSSVRRKLIFDD